MTTYVSKAFDVEAVQYLGRNYVSDEDSFRFDDTPKWLIEYFENGNLIDYDGDLYFIGRADQTYVPLGSYVIRTDDEPEIWTKYFFNKFFQPKERK